MGARPYTVKVDLDSFTKDRERQAAPHPHSSSFTCSLSRIWAGRLRLPRRYLLLNPLLDLATSILARSCHLNLLPDHVEVVPEDFPYAPALLNHVDVAWPLLFRGCLAGD